MQQISYIDLGASFILHNEFFLMGLSLHHLNQPNIGFDQGAENRKQLAINTNFAYEFNLNPFERGLLPRHTYLLTYAVYSKQGKTNLLYLSQELQLAELAFGINQQLSFFNGFNFSQLGFNTGISFENFDFGIVYLFHSKTMQEPMQPGYSNSI